MNESSTHSVRIQYAFSTHSVRIHIERRGEGGGDFGVLGDEDKGEEKKKAVFSDSFY